MPSPSLHVDVEQVYDEAMRLGARAVIVELPANPTSRQVPADDLLRLAALLARASARLIVDESFADFGAAPHTLGAHLATNPNVVIIKSKAYGVAGLRLGYLACADEELLGAVQAELPIWNINGPAEAFLRLLPRYSAAFDESMVMSAPIRVNSWNSWDPLRRVIVGRADGTMVQALEPAIRRDWPDDGFPLDTYGPIPPDMTAKATDQLDNLARLLRRRGIQVDRPEPLEFSQPVSTPLWINGSMFGCAPPRDVLITIGNEILESTMSYRSRWFEYLCYRPLIERYYRSDPDARWEAAPKPRSPAPATTPGSGTSTVSSPAPNRSSACEPATWS